MSTRENAKRSGPLAKTLLAVALIAIVAGVGYPMLVGTLGVGVLIFAAGVVLLGVGTLLGGRDRAVGWVLVSIGTMTALADGLRLLFLGPW